MATRASDDELIAILAEAVKEYERNPKNKIGEVGEIPLDLNGLMREIDVRLNQFSEFRDKGKGLRNAVKPVVSLLKFVADTAGDAVSFAPVSTRVLFLFAFGVT